MSSFCRMNATIHFGPLVDGYLSTEGAIAQAVDRNTILLRSPMFGMSPSDQLILILHELAHLQQLAQPGQDPVGALEDEAWEAAHVWMAGQTYRVRGKARRRLNAIAIIQGGKEGHPAAPPWYKSNPVEPIGNGSTIKVDDTTVINEITFESVLDEIIKQKKQKEIVVVCHGWTEGLSIPLVARSRAGAEKEQINPLSADGNLKDLAGGLRAPVISDKQVADQTYLTEPQVKAFRAKMNQIRDLQLEHVAFRACDMGRDEDLGSMQAFRNFFGAKTVSAPKLYDSYGQFIPLFIGGGVEAWAKVKRQKEGFRIGIDQDTGVAFGTKRTDSRINYQIICRAPDKTKFDKWLKAHIADRVGIDGVTVYHGMMDWTLADQQAQYIYFVRDNSFISNIVNYPGRAQ